MRPLLPLLALGALGAAIWSGCAKGPADRPAQLGDPHPFTSSEANLPDPERQGGHVGRAPRRLTVAQLQSSIAAATGTSWKDLDSVAPSLGRADYALVVSESADANLVFAKFLEDGARQVCKDAAAADLAKPQALNRVLARELPDSLADLTALPDARVRANLVYLSTRFWGAPLAGPDLDAWAALFKDLAARAQVAGARDQAFAATCIALMTDPRFLTY